MGNGSKELNLNEIERLAQCGLSEAQIAHVLKIGKNVIGNNKRRHPEVQAAIDRGRATAIRDVARSLFNGAVNGDTAKQIFYLKNRDPENWGDVKTMRHEGDGLNLNINTGVGCDVGPESH